MKFPITLLTLTCIFISFSGIAQIKKGEKMLGASISYSNGKNEYVTDRTIKTSQFDIQPSIGFGLGKNWIIGGMLGYNNTNQKEQREGVTMETEIKANVFAVGAWVRKFYPLTTQFGIYGQGNAVIGFGKGKRLPDPSPIASEADISSYGVDVQPGFYFLPGKKVIIEATFGTIGYSYLEQDYKEGTPYWDAKNSDFNFSVTDGLSLGVKFIL